MNDKNKNFILKADLNGRKVKLDKESAKKYAELGLKSEKYLPVLQVVESLCKREQKTPLEFVQELKNKMDNSLKTSLLEKVGGDEQLAEKLFQLETANEISLDYKDDMKAIRESFPEYKTIDDLPDKAVILSETNDISLFDALLRYRFLQNRKIESELLKREKNAKKCAGSQKTNDTFYGAEEIGALIKSIRK